jgi:hypothetical protein
MFSINKTYSKTVKSLLTEKETKREAEYTIPQFGPAPAKDRSVRYSEEDAALALQELVSYFGADEVVRHINWALKVAAQRHANNALRGISGGADDQTSAMVAMLINKARREAESDTGEVNSKGELIVNRKSPEYEAAFRACIANDLAKPKFAHLKPIFEGAESGEKIVKDLTPAGSLNSADEDETNAE